MTLIEIPPAARAARNVAWSVGHDIEELREAYVEILLALDRVQATTQGSSHPLPARVLRSWSDGLALVDEVQAYLADGIEALREVPDVRPLGTTGDLIGSWAMASCGVHRVTASLVQLRQRVATAADQLTGADPLTADQLAAADQLTGNDQLTGDSGGPAGPGDRGRAGEGGTAEQSAHPAALAARSRWRGSLGVLDLLIARLQHGVAALNAYADGVSGVSPRRTRRDRLAAVLPHVRYPPESVAAGAELAVRLVRAARHRRHPAPVPPHLRVPLRRELLWALRRPPLSALTWHLVSPWSDRSIADYCLGAVEHLVRGNTQWYADRVELLRDAQTIDGYAVALAAGLVAAAERRFPDRDQAQVRAVAHRLVRRYVPTGGDVDAELAEGLLWAALGDGDDVGRADRRAALVATGTLLLLDLLADERPTRSEWAGFRADAAELADSIGVPDAAPNAGPGAGRNGVPDAARNAGPDAGRNAGPDAAGNAGSGVGRRGPTSH